MARPTFYRLIGRLAVPCTDLHEWARCMERVDRIVEQTEIGPLFVSTVFLGVDHNHFGPSSDAILFETMIFGEPSDYHGQTRCATWAEAEKMHAEAVAYARELLAKADAALAETHEC